MIEIKQKLIFQKYIKLHESEIVNIDEISETINEIKDLYSNRNLTHYDYLFQKIQIINKNLNDSFEIAKRQRTKLGVKLNLDKELIEVFKKDLSNHQTLKINNSNNISNSMDISISSIQIFLENLLIPKRKIKLEIDFEKFVYEQLSLVFGNEKIHRQYSVGGFLSLKTDIDIENGKVGIELKIADNLSATDMQRLIGQLIYYKKRFYKNNLILFIVSKSTISPTIKELINFVEEFEIPVVFGTAYNI